MLSWSTFVGNLLVAVATIGSATRSHSSDAVRSELLEQAPIGWKRIARLAEHLGMTQVRYGEDRSEGESKSMCKFSDNSFLFVSNLEAYGRNGTYSFQLRRQRADRPWLVKRFAKTPDPAMEDIFRLLQLKEMALPQLTIAATYLPEIFARPSFLVSSAGKVQRGSQFIVEFSFEYAPPDGEKPRFWPSKGSVILDPSQSWVVLEYDVEQMRRNGQKWRWRQRNKLETQEGLPVYAGHELELDIAGQPRSVEVSEVTEINTDQIPEQEFMLAALGLPEISPESPAKSLRFVAIIVAIGVLCVLGALMLRRKRGTTSP